MAKFEVLDMANGEVFEASTDDACKAMSGLESLRKQRAFLIGRLGVFRKACVTLRVRKQRTEAEVERLNGELMEARRDSEMAMRLAEKDRQALLDTVERLNAELDAERAETAKWRDIAERCFASAMKNAVALADERKGERGE